MNHAGNGIDEENKTPITRVFNLNGLRKNSHRTSLLNSNSNESSKFVKFENNNKAVAAANDEAQVQMATAPIVKRVYNVYNNEDLSNFSNSTIKSQKFKSQNENIELATPTSPPVSLAALALSAPAERPNELIKQHKSEIDIDERYVSKKMNPVYKSDSEGGEDEQEEETDYREEKAVNVHSFKPVDVDFDDYNNVYQDPTQLQTQRQDSVRSRQNLTVVQVERTPREDEIYATINENDLYLTPVELKLDNNQESVKELYIKDLKADMMKEYVSVKVSCSVLRENIAVVCVYDRLWVAGLSSANVSRSLYRHLYIGDVILAINEITANNIYELNSLIDKYKGTSLELRVKRLPYARTVFIPLPLSIINTLDNKYQKHAKSFLGMKLESGKPRIEKIEENSVVYKSGLRYNPNRFDEVDVNDEKNRFTTWMLTEINGNPVGFNSDSEHVAKQLFTSKDNDICFIVQPTDLMKILFKELKKKYQNWKNYTVA